MNADHPYDRTDKGMKSQLPSQLAPSPPPNMPDARMAPRGRGPWLKGAAAAVWVLVVVIVFKTWCVEGLFLPLVVPGGSMAVTLLGTHRTAMCEDCGFRFHCGSDLKPVGRRAVCPNCGFAENDLAALDDVCGDRLLIHKSVFFFRRPRPWEVVAFRDPAQADQIMVKRVVGLPGETISLKHGDVYANGKIRRQPSWLRGAMAVLVHDSAYSTGNWIADGRAAAWVFADGRFSHAAGSAGGTVDWLTFCPGRPITDLCGYNQTRPRRVEDIHAVSDLMLSLRVLKVSGRGSMLIRIGDARSEFSIRFTVTQTAADRPDANDAILDTCELRIGVLRDGESLKSLGQKSVSLPNGFAPKGVVLEVSLFDRCLLVSVDGQEVVNYPYSSTGFQPVKKHGQDGRATLPSDTRLPAIGSDGLGLVLDAVRVYRDVYYAAPLESLGVTPTRGVYRLGEDEYFVLGDNSPISVDSRNWGPGRAVSHKLLLGKPLAVHYPSTMVDIGGRRFQVPDIGRIRYIR
jgi:signal peptidase I